MVPVQVSKLWREVAHSKAASLERVGHGLANSCAPQLPRPVLGTLPSVAHSHQLYVANTRRPEILRTLEGIMCKRVIGLGSWSLGLRVYSGVQGLRTKGLRV